MASAFSGATLAGSSRMSATGVFSESCVSASKRRTASRVEPKKSSRSGWSSPGGHYQVELWGRNITNKQYANTVIPGSKVPQVIVGAPRTFGVQLNYTY